MNNRIWIFLIFLLTLCLSLSAVSASDNLTDALSDNACENLESDSLADAVGEEVSADEVGGDSLSAEDAQGTPVEESNVESLSAVDAEPASAVDEGEVDLTKNAEPSQVVEKYDVDVVAAKDSGSKTGTQKKATSKIASSNAVGYTKFKTKLTFNLTADKKPLAHKKVKIVLNGKTYNKYTNRLGKVTLNVILKKGTYYAKFSWDGDNKTAGAKGSSKITIKNAKKTKLKLGDKDINYRQGSDCEFFVRLLTKDGSPIKKQMVTFKVAGKTFKAKTNKQGYAKIFLNLKKGKYKVRYMFKGKKPYLPSSGSYNIKVRAKMPKGDGYWLWPVHMNSLNLNSLAKKGTKHLFLHVEAISAYGKGTVLSFIKNAHRHGIKVHMWMQVCCIGESWTRPVNKDGSIRYGFINEKIAEAKRYARMPGVDGVHFDYMRFGGTAHLYKNSDQAITYFAKKASIEIHKVNSNCIVSGALMPEPSMMHYYYGQDVPSISRYMDALLPMVYKGNYHQNTPWIKSVTKTFVKQSNGAQIWTGLQSYKSDNNVVPLSHSTLLKDAKMAKSGGAKGIILFRIGISPNFNFKMV